MSNSARVKAPITLAPTPIADGDFREDKDDAQIARKERMDRQRALRLARQTAGGEAAEAADAGEKPVRLPQAHRRQC